jgi:hypothetical protein
LFASSNAAPVVVNPSAEDADAASVMADADVTDRTTSQKLEKVDPFLERLTLRDLRNWADHKSVSHLVHPGAVSLERGKVPIRQQAIHGLNNVVHEH